MLNYYYKETIEIFKEQSVEEILGRIAIDNRFDTSSDQINAWKREIEILQKTLINFTGTVFFEFSVPRMGKRIDALVIIQNIVFVIEFKVGETKYYYQDLEQVWDYSLDLKYFHEPSHEVYMAPILVATNAISFNNDLSRIYDDRLFYPFKSNESQLKELLSSLLLKETTNEIINADDYANGRYSPTPTIIEAALSLYNSHTVSDITRNDAHAINLSRTTVAISEIIKLAQKEKTKIICFVTGVPGAGKTLVGLNIATQHLNETNASVYLSGNAPLVAILQEALTRDKHLKDKIKGLKTTKRIIKESVKAFIQIIHHYRDAYLVDSRPPYDHIAIFDEAQRAWNREQTINFMKRKKNRPDFDNSEPEFLISCLDRHKDWSVIICLVGGGQEINTGEAGISEWLNAILSQFVNWSVYISPQLFDAEYNAEDAINKLENIGRASFNKDLHLAVSLRSFRAENVSTFVKHLLDLDENKAADVLIKSLQKYPLVLSRDLNEAKAWLKEKARGSERYGIVVSSQAQRLKPLAVDVKSPMNPINWFLDGKEDVRSSYFLEDVATEFHIQGLELDWTCVVWDGDLRYSKNGWDTYSFVGTNWNKIRKEERKKYLINSYRVLLTRARQGMIIVIPEGNKNDHTRKPEFYDSTYNYLCDIGIMRI